MHRSTQITFPRTRVNRVRSGGGVPWDPRPPLVSLFRRQAGDLVRARASCTRVRPLGPDRDPERLAVLDALPSVTTPASVIRAMLPLVVWVNHTEPSGEAAMSCGPGLSVSGNCGPRRCPGRARRPPGRSKRALNQTSPSGRRRSDPAGRASVGVSVTFRSPGRACRSLWSRSRRTRRSRPRRRPRRSAPWGRGTG